MKNCNSKRSCCWYQIVNLCRCGGSVRVSYAGRTGCNPPQVWLCVEGHACAKGTSAFFCFAFDEVCPASFLRTII